jgi:hypothetical protein
MHPPLLKGRVIIPPCASNPARGVLCFMTQELADGRSAPLRMATAMRRLDWLFCFLASSLVVCLGVIFGREFVSPPPLHNAPQRSFLLSFVNWDGNYYRDIAESGYSYDPNHQSTIHFFPLYPVVSRCVKLLTGVSTEAALVLTSHLCFGVALYLLACYADLRCSPNMFQVRMATLLAASFVPAGMFFHMAYSESLFFLLCVLALYLMGRNAPPVLVALAVGLATAARPVGVALIPALLVYVVRSSRERRTVVGTACLCLPLSASGLLLFMSYSQGRFGDALAFAHNTALWEMRPRLAFWEKSLYLGTFLPLWSIINPSSPAFFEHYTLLAQAPFSLYVANPLYILAAIALLAVGVRNRWLNVYETLTSLGLLLIPYWTLGYEGQMTGMARYVVVIVPLYLVLGRLLTRLPSALAACLLALSGFFLAAYAALFVRWYWFV